MSDTPESIFDAISRERRERTAAYGLDLLPCPFCGEDPFIEIDEVFDTEMVMCECGAGHSGDPVYWNSRVGNPKQGKH